MADLNMEKAGAIKGKLMSYMGAHWVTQILIASRKLGLFDALESFGAQGCTVAQLAAKTGLKNERILKEWMLSLLSNGFLESRSEGCKDLFILPTEVSVFFKDDGGPHSGFFAFLSVLPQNLPTCSDATEKLVREGTGLDWGDLPSDIFSAVAKFFQPVYKFLLPHWLSTAPELSQLHEALSTTSAATILDVGCGYGISTCVLGKLYPKSKVLGVDYHQHSIDHAKTATAEEGLSNLDYVCCSAESPEWHESEAATAVFMFDCFHDMVDPQSTAKQTFEALKPGGAVVLVEPLAADEPGLENALSMPTTPIFAPISAHLCTPCGLGPDGKGKAMGACAPTSMYREIFDAVGFKKLEVVNIEGEMGPMANGFRLIVIKK